MRELFSRSLFSCLSADKIAAKNKILRRAVVQELIIEYDEYVADHLLPLAKSWGLGQRGDGGEVDEEIGMMAEILKGLRDYIHKSMCDIMVRSPARTRLEVAKTGIIAEYIDTLYPLTYGADPARSRGRWPGQRNYGYDAHALGSSTKVRDGRLGPRCLDTGDRCPNSHNEKKRLPGTIWCLCLALLRWSFR